MQTIRDKSKMRERINSELIKKMRKQYSQWILDLKEEEMCKMFDVESQTIRSLLYFSSNSFSSISIENMIKLSNMFDIDIEEFIDYNAKTYNSRVVKNELIEEENEDMLKQYSVGKKWEDKILDYYTKKGYFSYKIPTMNSGTVFDIMVVRKGACLMIECKHIDGDKLYYAGSGILKKRDEIDHFIETTGNNLYIYVNSEKTGTWWTTWLIAKPIFEKKGYIERSDCFTCVVE